jgi:hypothetical protein
MLFIPSFFLSFRATPCVSETACATTAISMTVEWKATRSVSKYVRGRLSLEKEVKHYYGDSVFNQSDPQEKVQHSASPGV